MHLQKKIFGLMLASAFCANLPESKLSACASNPAFVELACGEQDIAFTMTVRCMCVGPCMRACVRLSE